MPPTSERPGSPADWMARARGDLAIARAPLPEGAFYEDLCFHAQQAVEKALKAIYQHYGWPFRYTHDLEVLLHGLTVKGLKVPDAVLEADLLSRYAWEARYPSVNEPVDAPEWQDAVVCAEAAVAWAQSLLDDHQPGPT